jgi:hypothetical protein
MDHLGVYQVFHGSTGQISDVFAGKDHGLETSR